MTISGIYQGKIDPNVSVYNSRVEPLTLGQPSEPLLPTKNIKIRCNWPTGGLVMCPGGGPMAR